MTRPALLAVLCAALALAGGGAAAPSHHEPKVFTVVIDKMTFGASPATLHVGDIVVWDNRDIFQHSATATDLGFDVELRAGAQGRAVMKHAGTIGYYCRYHPGMKGRLNVVM